MAGSIKGTIQKISGAGMPAITSGNVTAEDPLRVTLEDDQKINLSAASLIIPPGKAPLREGNIYYLLSVNNNKIYYVLDWKGSIYE